MTAWHPTDEQLSAHIDGVLAAAEAAQVEAHVADCEDCAARIDLLRATSRAVAGLPDEDLPRPLDLGFLREPAQAPTVMMPGPRRGRPPAWVMAGLAAAAVLMVAVVTVPRLTSGTNSTTGISAGLGGNGLGPRGDLSGGAAATPLPGSPWSGEQLTTKSAQGQGSAAQAPAVSGAGPAEGGGTNTLVFPGAGNIKVRVTTASRSVRSGSSLRVGLDAFDPDSDQPLDPLGLVLVVRRGDGGDAEQVLGHLPGGSSGVSSVPAQQSRGLTADWTAGEIQGQVQTGGYVLFGRVYLSGGRVLEVPLSIVVSQ